MRKSRIRAGRLSDAGRAKIAERYKCGESVPAIANQLGFSQNFVLGCVRRAGVAIRPKTAHGHILNPEQKERLVAEYVSGATCKELAERYGFKQDCSVWELLKHRGVTRPSSVANRRYTLNEAAFDAPLSNDAAYWAGIFITDGFVSDVHAVGTSDIVGITLSSRDRGHLQLLCGFLGTNRPIRAVSRKKYHKSYNSGAMSRLHIRSQRLADSLKAIGVVPRKTHVAEASESVAMSANFWRGCIDGDGSIYVRRMNNRDVPYLELCGASEKLLHQFSSFCRTIAPECAARVRDGKHSVRVRMCGRHAVRIIRALYGSGGVSLARKQSTADQIISAADY